MKKIALLLPAVLLSFGALATPGSADDGTDADQPVADPGIAALHNAVAAFRELRGTEDACRGAQATEQCKDARNAYAVAILSPRHATDRLSAIAQLVGLVIAVERERDGATGAPRP